MEYTEQIIKKIAFLGTGLLGNPMAHQLLEAGYDLIVYNRTIAKTTSLKEKGATLAQTPAQAIENADVIITMLTDYAAIEDVLFSQPPQHFQGKVVIQMSTIAPVESRLLKQRLEELGNQYMEAPVLGSIPQAQSRTLTVLFGGMTDQFKTWGKFLEVFGHNVVRMGHVGQAAAAKLALNQLIASMTTAFSMSLGYVRENGISVQRFMEIIRKSALFAPTFDKKLSRMVKRNFSNPNFPLKHLLKDVDLMLTEFNKKKINTASLQGIKKIILEAIDNGDGEMDYSALYNVVHPVD